MGQEDHASFGCLGVVALLKEPNQTRLLLFSTNDNIVNFDNVITLSF